MPVAVIINAEQILNMITDGALFFIIASGLAMIFGLMNIINFAHGSFIMVGAYGATEISQRSLNPWLGFPVGLAVGLAVGLVAEFVVIRWLYDRPWDTILATIGLSLITVAAVSVIVGKETQTVRAPLEGEWDLGFTRYSSYRVVLLIVAVCLFAVLWYLTNRTRLGLMVRAVIMNETLAASHGINSQAVRRWTFVVGCGLAGFAGAMITPISPVTPYMGENFLVPAFMVVMVAYSSVGGLAAAALLFGATQSWVTFLTDRVLLGSVSIIILTAVILRVMPQGFTTLSVPNGFQVIRAQLSRGNGSGSG